MSRAALALLLAGCTDLAFEGVVTNAHGEPLPGVLVTSEPGRCAGTTNAQGLYYARCKPGSYTLTATLDGHYATSTSVTASERVPHAVPPLVMYPQPTEPGPWLLVAGALQRPASAPIERRDALRQRSYCLVPDAPDVAPISAGDHQLIDTSAAALRLFALDEDGCARREVWRAGAWRVDAETVMPLTHTPLGEGVRYTLSLEPGDYVLAPWDSSRFTVVNGQGTPAEAKRYAGFRITAQ